MVKYDYVLCVGNEKIYEKKVLLLLNERLFMIVWNLKLYLIYGKDVANYCSRSFSKCLISKWVSNSRHGNFWALFTGIFFIYLMQVFRIMHFIDTIKSSCYLELVYKIKLNFKLSKISVAIVIKYFTY